MRTRLIGLKPLPFHSDFHGKRVQFVEGFAGRNCQMARLFTLAKITSPFFGVCPLGICAKFVNHDHLRGFPFFDMRTNFRERGGNGSCIFRSGT